MAELLGNRNTYCIGTLRSNRKLNPKEGRNYKLQKGQCFSLRSDSNVMVMKWKDKRDIYMCSTKTKERLKGRTYAQSHSLKVQTKRIMCNVYLCQDCFFSLHRHITK